MPMAEQLYVALTSRGLYANRHISRSTAPVGRGGRHDTRACTPLTLGLQLSVVMVCGLWVVALGESCRMARQEGDA